MRFPSLRRHSRLARDLDAYVDGGLARARVRELEQHLAGCTSCARIVEESQLLKRMAAALPEVAAPRSFRVTADMVAAQPLVSRQLSRAPVQRWQLNLVGGAAALAIFGFVVTVTVDLGRGGGSNSAASSSNAPNGQSAGETASSKSFFSGAAAGTTSPSVQSLPAAPNPAVASPTAAQDSAPRSGGIAAPPGVEIGPGGNSRNSDGSTSMGAGQPAAPTSSSSDRGPYRFFEAGFAVAAVLLGVVAVLIWKRPTQR